jgi:hypothetical protein
MSLGVLGEYAKSLFASSHYMHRFFLRILHMRIDAFLVVSIYAQIRCHG